MLHLLLAVTLVLTAMPVQVMAESSVVLRDYLYFETKEDGIIALYAVASRNFASDYGNSGGARKFLNAVRAGSGPPELDSMLCENAQCKAVLTMYMAYNKISNPSPHTASKPAGVDQAFLTRQCLTA